MSEPPPPAFVVCSCVSGSIGLEHRSFYPENTSPADGTGTRSVVVVVPANDLTAAR